MKPNQATKIALVTLGLAVLSTPVFAAEGVAKPTPATPAQAKEKTTIPQAVPPRTADHICDEKCKASKAPVVKTTMPQAVPPRTADHVCDEKCKAAVVKPTPMTLPLAVALAGRQLKFRVDDKGTYATLKPNGGNVDIVVEDKDQKIIYKGPYNTEADKAAAPRAVGERLELLFFDFRKNAPAEEPKAVQPKSES